MLDLKDPQYPEKNLGTLELSVTLSPKEDITDAVRNSCKITNFSKYRLLSFIRGQHFLSMPNTHPHRHVETRREVKISDIFCPTVNNNVMMSDHHANDLTS